MAKNKHVPDPIFLRDKVDVVSTEADPHHATGETFKVHPKVAERLCKDGLATMPGEETGAKGKSKKTAE